MRRLLPVLLLAALVLGTAAPARADDTTTAAMALRRSTVYQAPGVDVVDAAALRSELTGSEPRVLLAVLPADDASSDDDARSLAGAIGAVVGDPDAVVLVVTGDQDVGAGQGSTAVTRGADAQAALRSELAASGARPLTRDQLTALVTSFAERVADQVAARRTAGTPRPSSNGSSGRGSLLLLVGAGVAVALVAATARRQRRQPLREDLRAEGEQPYERLGAGGDR